MLKRGSTPLYKICQIHSSLAYNKCPLSLSCSGPAALYPPWSLADQVFLCPVKLIGLSRNPFNVNYEAVFKKNTSHYPGFFSFSIAITEVTSLTIGKCSLMSFSKRDWCTSIIFIVGNFYRLIQFARKNRREPGLHKLWLAANEDQKNL